MTLVAKIETTRSLTFLRTAVRVVGLLALLTAFQNTPVYAACSGTCAADADCSAKTCVFCNTDFGVCSDCCEFVDSTSCPSACTWTNNECRNAVGTSCTGLPETPESFPKYLYIVLLAGILGIAWFGKKRLSKTKN